MRVLYLTKCTSKFSAYEDFKCSVELLKDGKFSFLYEKRKNMYEALKPKNAFGASLWRIYKGKFWEGLHMHALPKAVKERIFERTIVLHPIMGMLSPEDKVCKWYSPCDYGRIKLWENELHEYLKGKDFIVFNFLPNSFEKMFPKSINLVNFRYTVKNKPLKDSSLVKAYTMRYIVEKDITDTENLSKINFLDFKVTNISIEKNTTTVYMEAEGKYKISKAGII